MNMIACIIPAYNEALHIEKLILNISQLVDYIIVVNDASTDNTADLVRHIQDKRVMLLNHEKNKGVGGAMITGYKKALDLGVDIVVKLDGDGQMNPAFLEKLVQPILSGDADYTKGVRFHHLTELKSMPRGRIAGNTGLSFFVKAASGYWNIFDPANGYTAIGRTALANLPIESLSTDYFFESDMLISLSKIRAVVVDVSIPANYGNETSRLNPFQCLISFPLKLFNGMISRIFWQYFLVDFSAFSAFFVSGVFLFSFGMIFGLIHWIKNALLNVSTPTGTIMIATLTFISGFQLLLQAVVLDIHNVPKIPLQSKLSYKVKKCLAKNT